MLRKSAFIFAGLIVMLTSSLAVAETVYLKNGKSVTGEIVDQQESFVKIMVGGIPFMYFSDEIERIDKSTGPSSTASRQAAASSRSKGLRRIDQISKDKRELILRLLEENGTRVNIVTMFGQTLQRMPTDQQEYYRKILKPSEIVLQLIPVYDKFYTTNEIKELIKFYSSPLGKKFVATAPDLVKESAVITVEYFENRIPGLKKARTTD